MYAPESFNIIITDQNHHIRDLLRRELKRDRYNVTCVKNGNDICHLANRKEKTDLIILDPDLLSPYGNAIFEKVLQQNSGTYIIIHTYSSNRQGMFQNRKNITVVEKNESSIIEIKRTIRDYYLRKAGRCS